MLREWHLTTLKLINSWPSSLAFVKCIVYFLWHLDSNRCDTNIQLMNFKLFNDAFLLLFVLVQSVQLTCYTCPPSTVWSDCLVVQKSMTCAFGNDRCGSASWLYILKAVFHTMSAVEAWIAALEIFAIVIPLHQVLFPQYTILVSQVVVRVQWSVPSRSWHALLLPLCVKFNVTVGLV